MARTAGPKGSEPVPSATRIPEYIISSRGGPDGEFRFFTVDCTVTDNQ